MVSRLAERVASIEFEGGHSTVSISVGVVEFPHHAVDMGALIRQADAALYRAKANGGGRVYVGSVSADGSLVSPQEAVERHRMNLQHAVATLARAVEAHDGYTHLHSHGVAFYAAALASSTGMDDKRVELVRTAGVLHDVGKIAVPEEILWKEGPLTPGEALIMRQHSETGRRILVGAGLPEVAGWVAHLHERFDGSGYPDGLAGEGIPLESRVLKVADALEAMTTPRGYRASLDAEGALAELRRGSGTDFDPAVADLLIRLVGSGRLKVRESEREPSLG